jgi:hypothetical protein
MTGCSAVNARTLSATATAATVPAEIFKNCRRDKNMMLDLLLANMNKMDEGPLLCRFVSIDLLSISQRPA